MGNEQSIMNQPKRRQQQQQQQQQQRGQQQCKGNKFDDDNGQLLVTCPGFCPGFSRVCLNLHYKLLQD